MIKIGILKEGKIPIDRRVPLIPEQCIELMKNYKDLEIVVQPSNIRAILDEEYSNLGIKLQNDLSDCDILMGVKEVNMTELIPNKKYLFFSHTAKEQPYNRKLLQAILDKNIQIIDYEYLKNDSNQRVVAFGRYAGIVGAYNGLLAFGLRTKMFNLKRTKDCFDLKEMLIKVKDVKFKGNERILITGGGRVAKGALETLAPLNLKMVTPDEFLNKEFNEPVVCKIDADNYVERIDGNEFEFNHFFANPSAYKSSFKKYLSKSDLYIAAHYWNPESPIFISEEDYLSDDFRIKVIADVSCDINEPIASTLRPSTVDNPFYGYSKKTKLEIGAFDQDAITVMAVDNLPCELPRDASKDFGRDLVKYVFPHLLGDDSDKMIDMASITKNGKLNSYYSYLDDYVKGL